MSNAAESLPRPVGLELEVEALQDKLMLSMTRRWPESDGRVATVKPVTDIPPDATFVSEVLPEGRDFGLDDRAYLTLWRGDWRRNGQVIKTIRFVARLAPADDPAIFLVKDVKQVVLLPGEIAGEPVMGMQPIPATQIATQPRAKTDNAKPWAAGPSAAATLPVRATSTKVQVLPSPQDHAQGKFHWLVQPSRPLGGENGT